MNPTSARTAVAAACLLLAFSPATQAFKIDTDNPELAARWGTTVGYSLGYRTGKPSAALSAGLEAMNFNDGDLNFSKTNRPITNRLADRCGGGLGRALSLGLTGRSSLRYSCARNQIGLPCTP